MYQANIIDKRKNKGVWFEDLSVGDSFINYEGREINRVYMKTNESNSYEYWGRAINLSNNLYQSYIITPVNIKVIGKEVGCLALFKDLYTGDIFIREGDSSFYIHMYPSSGMSDHGAAVKY